MIYFNKFAKGRAPYGARLFPPRGRRGGISTMPACVPRPDDWGTLMYFPGDPNPAEEATRYPRQVCRPRTGGSEEGAPPFPLVLVGGLGTSVQNQNRRMPGTGARPRSPATCPLVAGGSGTRLGPAASRPGTVVPSDPGPDRALRYSLVPQEGWAQLGALPPSGNGRGPGTKPPRTYSIAYWGPPMVGSHTQSRSDTSWARDRSVWWRRCNYS